MIPAKMKSALTFFLAPHDMFRFLLVIGFFSFQLGLSFPQSWLKSERARIDAAAVSKNSKPPRETGYVE
jgi:hypothetical protein